MIRYVVPRALALVLVPSALALGCSPSVAPNETKSTWVVTAKPATEAGPKPGQPWPLPTRMEEDRFFVEPRTADGRTVSLYTDTGGGVFIKRAAVEGLGLEVVHDEDTQLAKLPEFVVSAWIPPLPGMDGLPILDGESSAQAKVDAMLGQAWFRERVWTFDYRLGILWLRHSSDRLRHQPFERIALGFLTDESGERKLDFPRMQATIDGETIDFLFDTGAMVSLTDSAREKLADGRDARRATSFIVASKFDAWRARHPDWRVIENADAMTGDPMIEVPLIGIAGVQVGPVWFTRRADKNFGEFMSRFMDRPIEGALGGTALRYFTITVDYPDAEAIFRRRDDVKAAHSSEL